MLRRLTFLLASAYCITIGTLQAASPLARHSISENGDGNYVIGANDPYFVFNHKQDANEQGIKQYWQLPITLVSKPLTNKIIELEVFFDGQQLNSQRVFSAAKYLRVSIDPQEWAKLGGVTIKLPDDIRFANNSLLRLDINGCSKCEVSLNGPPKLSDTKQADYLAAKVLKYRIGVTELKQELRDIPVAKWGSNDIGANGKIIGNDPFLVSPLLDIDTNNLAGVYFEAVTEQKDVERAVFQLFYATETHGFIEAASIYAQVNANSDESPTADKQASQHTYGWYLPLDFLSKQNPRQEILERIRLDFSNHYAFWTLKKAQLVPESERDNYLDSMPKLLVQAKLQKANTKQVVQDIFSRLSRDLGFLFAYLLLLLATGYFFWRSYHNVKETK